MTPARANTRLQIANGLFEDHPDSEFALTVPGYYYIGKHYTGRTKFINPEAVMRIVMQLTGKSREVIMDDAYDRHRDRYQQYRDMKASYTGGYRHWPELPYSCHYNCYSMRNAERSMVAIGMPSISSRSSHGVVEWGVACMGCNFRKVTPFIKDNWRANNLHKNLKRVLLYSKDGFIDHLMECKPARDIFEKHFEKLCKSKKRIPVTAMHSCVLAGDGVYDEKSDLDRKALASRRKKDLPCRKIYPPPPKE